MTLDLYRAIPGFNGKFIISIKGKYITCWNTDWLGTGQTRQVKNSRNKNGYIVWNLNRINKQMAYWVAITFPELIENERFEGAEIDHKDTNRLNNMPDNLRWVTHRDNMRNPLTVKRIRENQTGEKNSSYGSKVQYNRKDQSKPVVQYTKDNEFIAEYPSTMEAQRQTGVYNARISDCCLGKTKTANGYIWRYA